MNSNSQGTKKPKLSQTAEITAKLSRRFNYDKIINEQFYIKNMSPKMIIDYNLLLQDELFKNVTPAVAQECIANVPFLKLITLKFANKFDFSSNTISHANSIHNTKNIKNTSYTHVKIQYENADRILIVSGIRKQVLQQWLQGFIKESSYRKICVTYKIRSGYWNFIQFSNQNAIHAKKYIRNKKLDRDLIQNERKMQKKQKDSDVSYKYPNRRVRIVLLSQQFFQILVDMINQTNYQKFREAMDSKSKSNLYKGLNYYPLYASQKNQQKQQQIDDAMSSEFLSQTSSAYENSLRMKQIDVQTSNQATQIQTVGVGIGIGMEVQIQLNHVTKFGQISVSKNLNVDAKDQIKIAKTDNTASQPQKNMNNNQFYQEKQSQNQAKNQKQLKNGSWMQSFQVQKNQVQIPKLNENSKMRTNSISYVSNNENFHKQDSNQHHLSQNRLAQAPKSLKIFPQLQQFPSLPTSKKQRSQKKHKNHYNHNTQKDQQNQKQKYIRIPYLQLKKKYNQFLRESEGIIFQPTIPEYIKKQNQSVIYKRKFHNQIIRKAQLLRISRRVSQL